MLICAVSIVLVALQMFMLFDELQCFPCFIDLHCSLSFLLMHTDFMVCVDLHRSHGFYWITQIAWFYAFAQIPSFLLSCAVFMVVVDLHSYHGSCWCTLFSFLHCVEEASWQKSCLHARQEIGRHTITHKLHHGLHGKRCRQELYAEVDQTAGVGWQEVCSWRTDVSKRGPWRVEKVGICVFSPIYL